MTTRLLNMGYSRRRHSPNTDVRVKLKISSATLLDIVAFDEYCDPQHQQFK